MKIIITGATGLIGQSLVKSLENEHDLILLDIDFSKEWNISELPDTVDVIIHLAQSHSYRDFPEQAMQIFNVNTYSTLKLLDYSRKAGVKQFIYASSGGIYGGSYSSLTEEFPIATEENLGFYLNSKLSSELLLKNYQAYFNILTLRFFFVYGPAQRKNMLIPRLIGNIKEGKAISLNSNEGIRLNPIYVDDAVEAIKNALKLKRSLTINIAGNNEVSLRELCDLIALKLGSDVKYIYTEEVAKNLVADINVMCKELYEPRISLDEGMTKMIKERFNVG